MKTNTKHIKKCIAISLILSSVLLSGCASNGVKPTSEVISTSESEHTTNTTKPTTSSSTSISFPGKECDSIMYAVSQVNVRKEPSSKSDIAFTLSKNDDVNVIFMYDNGWYEISKDGIKTAKSNIKEAQKYIDNNKKEIAKYEQKIAELS